MLFVPLFVDYLSCRPAYWYFLVTAFDATCKLCQPLRSDVCGSDRASTSAQTDSSLITIVFLPEQLRPVVQPPYPLLDIVSDPRLFGLKRSKKFLFYRLFA